MHVASKLGYSDIVTHFVTSQYIYHSNKDKNKYNHFDMIHQINLLTHIKPSNALHLAIESENYLIVKNLLNAKISIDEVNYRTLTPFQIT